MYILNIDKALKKMSINEIKDFIFENFYKRIWFSKASSFYSMKRLKKNILLLTNKLVEKMPDPNNAKQNYQSFGRKKYKKSVKQQKIITHQPKV